MKYIYLFSLLLLLGCSEETKYNSGEPITVGDRVRIQGLDNIGVVNYVYVNEVSVIFEGESGINKINVQPIILEKVD